MEAMEVTVATVVTVAMAAVIAEDRKSW